MISDETMNILRKQYVSVTKDISQPIDLSTLEVLTAKLGQNLSRHELEKMIKEVDQDANGTIEFDEFVQMMIKKRKQSELEMKDAFASLDRNKNGYISVDDLRHSFSCMGERLSSEEITLLLEEIDEDGDGYINFQEFLKLMYKEEEQI